MTAYIILVIMRKDYDLDVAVDRSLHESVTEFFDIPQESILPVLEENFCEADLINMKKHMTRYANQESFTFKKDFLEMKNKGLVVNMWPEGPPSESTYWIPEDILTENSNFIRKQMKFKSEYKRFADKVLGQISKSDKSGKEVLFVGTHCRRTDYVEFSKTILKKKVAGKSHFLEGIEYYQEEYPDSEVYFIAISDDMPWVRKNLGNIKGVVLAGMGEKSNKDRIPFGLNPIGIDLCLLASCNHTLVSQGQYGQWGAFLAGGDVYSQYGPMVFNILSSSD